MMETPKPKKRRWQHGRPRLNAQTVRNVVLRLRVNAVELAAIAEKANEMHMPVSRWLRHVALERRFTPCPVPAVNREMYAALGKIGQNINQLTKLAHQRAVPLATGPLEELEELLRKTKSALLGVGHDSQVE